MYIQLARLFVLFRQTFSMTFFVSERSNTKNTARQRGLRRTRFNSLKYSEWLLIIFVQTRRLIGRRRMHLAGETSET